MNIDIQQLKDIGQFFVDYGPWAVAIFEGMYIMYLTKTHRNDRKEWEQKRLNERKLINNTFEDHRKEVVGFVTEATEVKGSIS